MTCWPAGTSTSASRWTRISRTSRDVPHRSCRTAVRLRNWCERPGEAGGMTQASRVQTGLEVLRQQAFAPVRGLRVGLVTHPAAVDGQLRHAAEILAETPGVQLRALFGPEHGLFGEAQDLIG